MEYESDNICATASSKIKNPFKTNNYPVSMSTAARHINVLIWVYTNSYWNIGDLIQLRFGLENCVAKWLFLYQMMRCEYDWAGTNSSHCLFFLYLDSSFFLKNLYFLGSTSSLWYTCECILTYVYLSHYFFLKSKPLLSTSIAV